MNKNEFKNERESLLEGEFCIVSEDKLDSLLDDLVTHNIHVESFLENDKLLLEHGTNKVIGIGTRIPGNYQVNLIK
jgi:hypothetical protein